MPWRCAARLAAIALIALPTGAATAAPAQSAPHKRTLDVERQIVRAVEGYGCTSETVTAWFPHVPTDTWPGVGDWLRGRSRVLAVDVVGRRVTWTVGPDAETCASQSGDEWYWETGEASFSAAYRDRLYVVAATGRNGVRSVAGLPTRWRGRQGPSINDAKRMFGKPTSVHGSRYGSDVCYVRWARLGLRTVFANFVGRPACKSGWLQSGQVAGPRAREWAVVVDGSRDVPATVDTSLRYLREEGLARYNYSNEAWTLSEDYLPFGPEPGYYSMVSAILAYSDDWDPGNPVRGFGLWIGAAGE